MPIPPFSVEPVAVFNRFSTHELLNAFIGGAIVLVLLTEVSNIFHAVLYGTKHLNKRSIDRYVIFERLVTLRHVLRLFMGREPIVHYHSFSSNVSNFHHNTRVSRNYRVFLVPAVAAVLLYAAEFTAIYAGTTRPALVTGDTNFDPILAVSTTAPRTTQDESCDDFFAPSRGLLQKGKVLKCIKRSSATSESAAQIRHRISLRSNRNDNTHQIRVLNAEEKQTTFDISIRINTIGQGAQRLGVFRWDIENGTESSLVLFNGIVNGMLELLQLAPNSNVTGSSSVDVGVRNFFYEEKIDRNHEDIADALQMQLRRMDLVLNTTDAPWVFVRESVFERRTGLTVAIMSPNRVPHGLLLVLAVCLIVLRTVVNFLFTSFDDIAYIAVREIIEDDCVMGPLAANPRMRAKEVKPCYEIDMCPHRTREDARERTPFEDDDFVDLQSSNFDSRMSTFEAP